MPLTLQPAEFLSKYNLAPDALEKAGLEWSSLLAIFADHEANVPKMELNARSIVEHIRSVPQVHSIRYRVKDPEHLIEKIIRKRLERPEFDSSIENYRSVITDLVGVRALHLFKDEWLPIHQFMCGTWELNEEPTANLRKGDAEAMFIEQKCQIHHHKAGYRSVHYSVQFSPTKELMIAEVQVRTLFEEAWSEIDHRTRYPHAAGNIVLAEFLEIFNRLAGSADEMGTYVKGLQAHLRHKEVELRQATARHDEAVAALEKAISQSQLDQKEKAELEKHVKKLAAEIRQDYATLNASIPKFTEISALSIPTVLATRGLKTGFERTCEKCGKNFISIFDGPTCNDCGGGLPIKLSIGGR